MQDPIPTVITRIRPIAVFMFFMGSLFYIYDFALQVSPSVMTQELMQDFSANATVLGVIAASFYISYTFMQLPAGLILDRFGARLTLTIACITCAFGALLFGLAPDITILTTGRVLMGLGGAFAFTSSLYLILRWLPTSSYAFFVGITQILCGIGSLGGSSVLAILISNVGWRHSMILLSLIGFVIMLLSWLCIRNQPTDIYFPEKNDPPLLDNLIEILARPQTWYIALYSIAIWAPMIGFSALWGVPFLKLACHLSNVSAANAVALTWVGAALASPTVGWLSEKLQQRNILLSMSALLGLIALLILIFIPNLPLLLIYMLLFFVGVSAGGQSLIFAVVKDINRREACSTANGFNNMAVVGGGLLFQPLIGKMLDVAWCGVSISGERFYDLHGYHVALSTLPICSLIALIIAVFFIKETFCTSTYQT